VYIPFATVNLLVAKALGVYLKVTCFVVLLYPKEKGGDENSKKLGLLVVLLGDINSISTSSPKLSSLK
tara:strand:+ start:821 stop:1024 length:204 start_codon:yes stop_codon:yes gene_type:complete